MPDGVSVIADASELRALEQDWQQLWQRAPGTPFQSPAWMLAWWSQFGNGRASVAIVRESGRLVGLLAGYVLHGHGPPRLLPIGAGLSDSLDALIAPEASPGTAQRLLAALLNGVADADEAAFIDLPPDSPLRTVEAPAGWRAALHTGSPCPVLELSGNARLQDVVPARAHRKLRMNRNRAERVGGTSVQIATASTASACLDILFDLHAGRWSKDGQPGGVLADPRVGGCIREAAASLITDGAVRVAVLRIADVPAAACLAWATPDRLLLYMSGYDAAFAFCSPGSLLLGEMAEAALREGVRELHFLRGDEAYKYAWGATDRYNATRGFHRL